MGTPAQSLVSWAEFLRLPDRSESGEQYELHDGEVVRMPPPRPRHLKLQQRIQQMLIEAIRARGVVMTEFPYRPLPNLQYWISDVAYIPRDEWDALPPDEYIIYAPPLIVEVLSPSNTPSKLDRQRIVAMSGGTREFWVVDADKQIVQVTNLGSSVEYGVSDSIQVSVLDARLDVGQILR